MKTLAAVLTLAAVASVAHADVTLDSAGGAVYATSIEGTRAVEFVRAPDGKAATIDVVAGPGAQPIHRISHTTLGVAVHSGAGGSAPLTIALFRPGTPVVANPPFTLKNRGTGAVTKPSLVRTIVLDPADPGATLLDAGHLALAGGVVRAWVYVRRSSGEALLVDYDPAGGVVRRTPLGFTPPIGSNKGSLVAAPNGEVWAVFAGNGLVTGQHFEDMIVEVLQPKRTGTLAVEAGFSPESTRLGIIAILIGLLTQPAPVISYQQGDEVFAVVQEGSSFRTIARQTLPAGASGFMEDEGLFSFLYLLPYIEQDNVYKVHSARRDDAPEVLLTTGR